MKKKLKILLTSRLAVALLSLENPNFESDDRIDRDWLDHLKDARLSGDLTDEYCFDN